MKKSTIYTRRGDSGTTDLVGGVRIHKSDIRLEAYGTIDELSSHLGLLVATGTGGHNSTVIKSIQQQLFIVGAYLATDQTQTTLPDAARLPQDAITSLEAEIDTLSEPLPPLKEFILPGGRLPAAQAHVCRTVCRRAERIIAALPQTAPTITSYINRLSDYLFVLARHLNEE